VVHERRVKMCIALGACPHVKLRISNNPNLEQLLQRPLHSDRENLKASLGDTYPRSCSVDETRIKARERHASRRRALVATYGVASRSALITWSSVERNVISPLQAGGFSVTVVSFYQSSHSKELVSKIGGYACQPSVYATS